MSLPNKERHQQHSLTDQNIREIRAFYEKTKDLSDSDERKWSYRRLGTRYNVSHETIRKIVIKATYKWVEDD